MTTIVSLIAAREAPSLDVTPKEPQTISVGGQAMLYCSANGIPQPRVQWRRIDGAPMSSRHMIQESEPGYIM